MSVNELMLFCCCCCCNVTNERLRGNLIWSTSDELTRQRIRRLAHQHHFDKVHVRLVLHISHIQSVRQHLIAVHIELNNRLFVHNFTSTNVI